MAGVPEIQNIEEMRQREGIDDVELREAVRGLRVADVVNLTFLTGPSTWETLPVRITGRRGGRFQGELVRRPASSRLAELTVGSPISFSRCHIHSVAKRCGFVER